MLKLTDSFYRYLWFTCEKVRNSNLRRSAYTKSIRKCGGYDMNTQQTVQFHSSLQFNKHCNGKKKFKIKIPPLNSNACTRDKQMSDLWQPTTKHVTCGGTFDVSTEDDDPFEEWRRQIGEPPSGDEESRPAKSIPPNFRVWESVGKRGDFKDGTSFKFKVLSYNVLAQYLLECHPYLYTECSPRNLKWKVRALRLYDEITSLQPDILCLQEVQASHMSSFYSKFEQIGYFGIFKQKTGHRQDGCAIYFKQSIFEMEDHVSVEYYQPDLPILNRDNIGVMVKLIPRSLPGTRVVVATTHLLYNPKRTDVRLAQMQVLLAEIDRFAYYRNGRDSGHFPIILTGDFNSTPDSAVIKLLDRGHVSASPYRDSSDWKRIGVTDNCQHLSVYLNRLEGRTTEFNKLKIYNSEYSASSSDASLNSSFTIEQFSELFNSDVLGHSLQLCSAYCKQKPDGSWEASTYQDYWLTVDYIYFSCCSSLQLVERLRLPTVAECAALGRLPNEVYGSDHLALAALFAMRPIKSAL